MKIVIYSICWNEADMVEFYFKHYDPIAQKYIIFDDGSTDGTLELLRANPKVEIRPFPRSVQDSYVLSAQMLHNSVWQESRDAADWVIITAIDEHLVHPDLERYLSRCQQRGVTLIPALGYQMVSDDFPEPSVKLTDAVACGAPFKAMSKLSIFQPAEIRETNFAVGRHSAEPIGNVTIPRSDEVLNLHFKYLNFERLRARHEVLAGGLGSYDKKNGWGHRYSFSERELEQEFIDFKNAAVNLHDLGPEAATRHSELRWWRKPDLAYPVIEV